MPVSSILLQPTEAALFASAKFIFTSVDCRTTRRFYKLGATNIYIHVYAKKKNNRYKSTYSSCTERGATSPTGLPLAICWHLWYSSPINPNRVTVLH